MDFSHSHSLVTQIVSELDRSIRQIPVVIALLALQACSSGLQLSSGWSSEEIVVDGIESEWKHALAYQDESRTGVAFKNDDEFLYVCLVTSDPRTQAQILGLGLTIRFEPRGGKRGALGVHFPIGHGRRPPVARDPEMMRLLVEQSQRELEVIGPGENDRERMPLIQASGIRARIGWTPDRLVYELRVPLHASADHRFAVGAERGEALDVRFEVSPGPSDLPRTRTESAPAPRGGGRSRSGGAPPQISTRERPEIFSLRATVTLAANPL